MIDFDLQWHDIKELERFRENFEFNSFVVLAEDGTDSMFTDVYFGISQIPKEAVRFFCVPYDEVQES